MKWSIYLLVTIVITSCNGFSPCDRPQEAGGYFFQFHVNLAPAVDVFQIGDTIHCQASFSDHVYEIGEEKTFQFNEVQLGYYVTAFRIDTVNHVKNAIYDFDISSDLEVQYFDFSSGTTEAYSFIDKIDGRYSFKYEFVPTKAGLYYMASTIAPSSEPDFEGKCKHYDTDSFTTLNEGSNNNVDLLLASPDPYIQSLWTNDLDKDFFAGGGYCFYVEE